MLSVAVALGLMLLMGWHWLAVERSLCLVVDDMASTGRTLADVARALEQAGAAEIHAAFTHPVLAPGAMDAILAAPFGHLLTTDTLPPPIHARLEVSSVAPTLAQVLRGL